MGSSVLEAGGHPNPTYPKGMFRISPLTAAGFAGMPTLLRLLLDFEANPNACNPEGLTALHSVACAEADETKSVESILESGFFLSARSSFNSELAGAISTLDSVNVTPTDSNYDEKEEWEDSRERFYSPTSPTFREPYHSPTSPTSREHFRTPASPASETFQVATPSSPLRRQVFR